MITETRKLPTYAASLLTRASIEDFLFAEAALLDAWRLTEWYALFLPEARYEVPPTGAAEGADPAETLFYIADDYSRLGHRIDRLTSREAHAEFPRSTCVRTIGNVRVLDRTAVQASVASVFTTYRSKGEVTDAFMGHHLHQLVATDEGLRIGGKRSTLAMTSLRPQGRISIIL